jgi:glycosyltransferase involved in cell wall biosynthesis
VVGKPNPDGPVARTVRDANLGDVVRFVSGLSDDGIAELLGSAEIAVVPSLYEGFSIPAVEAMACATPLVATTGGALPEVVGDDAVLVRPGDSGEMADALEALFDDDARRHAIGEGGRRRIEKSYTWRRVAESMVEVYRDAIDRRRAVAGAGRGEHTEAC